MTLSSVPKMIGEGAASVSLIACVSFWILLAVGFHPLLRLTGFEVFKAMGAAVVLTIASLALGSKLCKFVLPFALSMLLFTMYVMGS
jgi:hypothetical protein